MVLRGGRTVRGVGLVVLGLVASCVSPATITCEDGSVCAASAVCAPSGRGCVDPAQVEACRGAGDGAACDLDGIGAGTCRDGVCVVTGCGDGVIDPGEACDDGVANGPDAACTDACARPTCGDGLRQGDEACDDGVANGDDRPCLPTCVRATCGDGRVQAGVEACDAGPGNADDGACTTGCARAACGDGLVWAGVEPCDDGNLASGDGCRADCRKVEACGDGEVDAGEACDDGNGNAIDGCDACVATTWQAAAIVAGATVPTALELQAATRVTADIRGAVYVSDASAGQVWRVSPDGALALVAGAGPTGVDADGGPATDVALTRPAGIAVDGTGNLYVVEEFAHRVRRIDPTGIITTVAGTGSYGADGVDGLATAAELAYPRDVAVDGLGNVYIGDSGNVRVCRVDAVTGILTVIAGGRSGFSGDGGPATAARLASADGLALAGDQLFVSDPGNHRVRRVDLTTGIIDTVVGTGAAGGGGDGGPALAATLSAPAGLAIARDGALLIADPASYRVRRVDPLTSTISTVVGTGTFSADSSAESDGGPATAAALGLVGGVAATRGGEAFVADGSSRRVRRIAIDGTISTFIGAPAGAGAVGRAATAVAFSGVEALAVRADGLLAIADPARGRVWGVEPVSATLVPLAGTGLGGAVGDGGPALAARLDGPADVVFDGAGNLYIAEASAHRVRRVDAATGVITTVAGTGVAGDGGDGGPATAALLALPGGLAFDAQGRLLVLDRGNHRVRRLDLATGIIETIAGTGAIGSTGDDGPALAATFDALRAIALDAADNIYVADGSARRVRRIDAATGIVTTVAGTGAIGFAGDDGPATAAVLGTPGGLAIDAAGDLYISDGYSRRVRMVAAASGIITTVIGDGNGLHSGDGQLGTDASLPSPRELQFDGAGNLWIAAGTRVRVRDAASGLMRSAAGALDPPGMGQLVGATLASPAQLTIVPDLVLVAGGASGTVQAIRGARDIVEAIAGRYPDGDQHPDLARLRGAAFGAVGGVVADAATGAIYLSESSNHRLHVVTPVDVDRPETWTIAPLAGDGVAGYVDGPAASARFNDPAGLFFDAAAARLLIADRGNHVVRALDLATMQVSTIAGTGATLGYFGDGLAATDALLYAPAAVTRCAATGDVFVADAGNHRVRRIAAGTGVITTVLGDGVAASSGQGAPAWTFPVDAPQGLACDAAGNLYVTSTDAVRLLLADVPLDATTGEITGEGAVQTIYGAPPRTTYPASATACLTGIAPVDAATLWVTDACAGMLVELWRQPAI